MAIYRIFVVFQIARLSQTFSCGHLLHICVFQIARLSQAFSCGHLLHICVFQIARLSQAFSSGHLLNILGKGYLRKRQGHFAWTSL